MLTWVQMLVTVVCAVGASSGFWAYIQKKGELQSAEKQMLVGLGHDRIVFLGMLYIDRGWIYYDEFENLNDYLYKPYERLGGNGSAKKIMDEVRQLDIRSRSFS